MSPRQKCAQHVMTANRHLIFDRPILLGVMVGVVVCFVAKPRPNAMSKEAWRQLDGKK